MAQFTNGLYTKLYLSVTARTHLGQTVHVTGSSSAGLNSANTVGAAETLPLVTSPKEWPVWRTSKPIIISRNVAHTYQYSLSNGDAGLDAESASGRMRTIVATEAVMRVGDVFGSFGEEEVSSSSSSSFRPVQRKDSLQKEVEFATRTKLHIVCYHLPIRLFKRDGEWEAEWAESLISKSSEGSISTSLDTQWIGTVTPEGKVALSVEDIGAIKRVLKPMNCIPVFSEHAQRAYSGYCKRVLWPAFHNVDILDQACAVWNDDVTKVDPQRKWDQGYSSDGWDAYEQLNLEFLDALQDIIREGDTVWVHDYHLMLLPSLLASGVPVFKTGALAKRKARIIFFMHIPFPTSAIFRSLARGEDLLLGLVGADVVGFHAFDHARHFLNACKRLMGLPHKSVQGGITGVEYLGRTVMVVVRYVSVEPEKVASALHSDETNALLKRLKKEIHNAAANNAPPPSSSHTNKRREDFNATPPLAHHIDDPTTPMTPLTAAPTPTPTTSPLLPAPPKKKKKVMASIDSCQRLSGIALKLVAFEQFLYDCAQWRGRVCLVQYALKDGKRPEDEELTSRDVAALVARINQGFGPGTVIYKELPSSASTLPLRLALWLEAHVLFSTAVREGHSLYPFEYILARRDSPGVILASEFSATAALLNGVLRLNPFDISAVTQIMDAALTMTASERLARHARDLPYVNSRPSGQWTKDILSDMWLVNRQRKVVNDAPARLVIPIDQAVLADAFGAAKRRVLVLDYGGTLVPKGAPMGKYLKRTTIDRGPHALLSASSNNNNNKKTARHKEPHHALLPALSAALDTLAQDPATTIYVVSGATMHALMSTLGHWPRIGLGASNGLCYSKASSNNNNDATHDDGGSSSSSSSSSYATKREYEFHDCGTDWALVKKVALPIFKRFTARTNGSRILTREPGIAWSYYRCDPEWGHIQAELLEAELEAALGAYDVGVHHMEGMIEMVPNRSHKGNIVKQILAEASDPATGARPDFILCCGDGDSDEKMFSSVYSSLADATEKFDEDHVFTITVGKKPSRALFYLKDTNHVLTTLSNLAQHATKTTPGPPPGEDDASPPPPPPPTED